MKLQDIRNTPLQNLLEDLFLKTDPLRFCLILFVISRLLIICAFWYGNIITPPVPPFINNFLRWDSVWYLNIAQHGYGTSTNFALKQPYAFFPLYPLLMHIVSSITGWSVSVSGALLSNLFFFLALYYLHRLLQDLRLDLTSTRFTLLLLALSPANVYFVSVYTESLFLALSLMSMSFAYRGQWLYAGTAAAFLSATHPNGICIGLPLLLILLKEWRQTCQFKLSYLSIFLVPGGLLLYMLYLQKIVGDPLAFFHAEAAWHRTGWQLGHLWVQFRDQYLAANYATPAEILFILSAITLYRRKYYIELTFLFIMFAPAFFSGSSIAFARFTEVLFPFYIGLMLLVQNKKYYPALFLVIFSLLLGINIMGWIVSAILI